MKISSTHVKAALIAEDVEGFINLGAPNNEYDREAEAITSALSSLSKLLLFGQKLLIVRRMKLPCACRLFSILRKNF